MPPLIVPHSGLVHYLPVLVACFKWDLLSMDVHVCSRRLFFSGTWWERRRPSNVLNTQQVCQTNNVFFLWPIWIRNTHAKNIIRALESFDWFACSRWKRHYFRRDDTRSWGGKLAVQVSLNIKPCSRPHVTPCRKCSRTFQGWTACVNSGFSLV